MIFLAISMILVTGSKFFMSKFDNSRVLRVAFPTKFKSTDYEPTKISLDFEYIFLENIYSPLVEMSKDGTVEQGVAEKIQWVGDELKLTIRKNLKTQSGKLITSKDVEFSLKRLLILSGNTHGNFKDIVCPGQELKSVEDPCVGIRIDSENVYLHPKHRKTFLIPMLTAIDFAIIPQASVDPKTLKILDYKETSGIYSVLADDGVGNIKLAVNKNHYHFAENIPREIILVPTDKKNKTESLDFLKNKKVDHITTIDACRSEDVIQFTLENPEFESHLTMKVRNLILVFTDRGIKELQTSERKFIGAKAKKAFADIFKDIRGMEQRDEFFPNLGEGGLTKIQKDELLKNLSKEQDIPKINVKVGILKGGNIEEWSNPLHRELPNSEYYLEKNVPSFTKYENPEDEPHVFIASIDTGFMEDISLISYALNGGVFGLSKSNREKWLADYMQIENKEDRIQKLKQLHFEALSESVLVPLMASPYTALVRKPWKMELSEIFANNQLWRIKHQ